MKCDIENLNFDVKFVNNYFYLSGKNIKILVDHELRLGENTKFCISDNEFMISFDKLSKELGIVYLGLIHLPLKDKFTIGKDHKNTLWIQDDLKTKNFHAIVKSKNGTFYLYPRFASKI